MEKNRKTNWKRAVILAGAIVAFTIGSGFATGQEIIQYFTAYGIKSLFVILIFAAAFLYYNYNFIKAGSEGKIKRGNDVYKYFCGKYVGTFCDYYSTLFCYMSFFVMIGGASSTLHQAYGIPLWVGGVVLAALTVITVVGGLNSMVDAIGVVGPVIVLLCMAIGLITCVRDGGNFTAGLKVIETGAYEGAVQGETIKSAGSNWLASGLSYAGFVLLWFASFTSALAVKNPKKELKYGLAGGTAAVCVTIMIIVMAQIMNINTTLGNGSGYVWNADIPNLILAAKIWKPFSAIFAVVVFAGIYTTAVPLLYNPVARFAREGTAKFRILTVILGIAGLLAGMYLPFRVLVNVIYVLNGYIGAVLILFMIRRNICDFHAKRKAAAASVRNTSFDNLKG